MNIYSIKVKPFMGKGGKAVPNQYIIEANKGELEFFQSYNTVIACKDYSGSKVKIYLDTEWKNSNTTNRYRCIFLGENSMVTNAKINTGEYTVTNLNTNFSKIIQLI